MSKYIPIESLYAALDFIEKSAVKGEEEKVRCITKAIRDIKFVPADVVEVVRCKECKWFGDIGCAIRIVDDSDRPSENDFCSFAERKDNG